MELSTCLTVKKARFLSNPGNKQRFIDLLSEYIIRLGFSCLNAQSDADVLICRTAVTLLQTKCNVTVVGDDTDLLVILIDMTRNLSLNRWKIFLSTKTNIDDLKSVITSLGVKGASSILLLHSFTGCDTVSRIFGVGQGRLLNIRGKLTESIIQTFNSHESTKEEIKSAGEKIFFLLLNISPSDGNLDAARLRLFNAKVIKGCAAIDSTSLPPTSAAAYEHSLKVYHQVQAWLEQDLDPTKWGWKIKEGCHVPVTSQLPAAPDEILEIIHCDCKTGCKQHQYSCVRHGIMCGPGCVNCTDNCENRADSDDFFCEIFFDFLKIIFLDVSCNEDHFKPIFFDFWKLPNYPISQLANYLTKKLLEKKLFLLLSPTSWLNPEPSTMIRTLDILITRNVV